MYVKEITTYEAKQLILGVHYAHRMPTTQYRYGLFDGEQLVGVVSFGPPATPQVRKSCVGRSDCPFVELNRLVVTSPEKNAASFLIGQAFKLLPKPMLVVSYADTGQGHQGYIYQATNFLFGGATKSSGAEYLIDGVKVHPRTLAHRGITDPVRYAKENGLVRVEPQLKNRYVLALGSKVQKRKLYGLVRWPLSYDYPKGPSVRYDAPNRDR